MSSQSLDLEKISSTLDTHTKVLDEHGKVLHEHGKVLHEHSKILHEHSKVLHEHGKVLHEHSNKLDSMEIILQSLVKKMELLDVVYASVVRIESVMQSYDDAYKINRDRIEDHEERIDVIEHHLSLPIIYKAK